MIDRIRIGLWWYRVVLANTIPSRDTQEMCAADGWHSTRALRLKRSTTKGGDWENSILHEAIHFLDKQSQLDLTERQTDVLANGMEAFIRDNPNFMRGEDDGNRT
jgi:hypothetical protein